MTIAALASARTDASARHALQAQAKTAVLTQAQVQTQIQARTAARRQTVAGKADQAMQSPRFEGPQRAKARARAKVQDLVERLKILKKLYAMNPKGMAKALAQLFKELKAAVKDYRSADKDEFDLAGAAVDPLMDQPPPTAPAAAEAPEAGGDTDANAAPAPEPQGPEPQVEEQQAPEQQAPEPQPPAADLRAAAAAYEDRSALRDAVIREVDKRVGEDGLDFLKMVRGLANAIADILEGSRKQTLIHPRDKETETAFQDASNSLKELRESLKDMEADIRQAAPDAGMKLSVQA